MRKSIVVLSGSGVSAESGLPTFRDANGLWRNHDWRELASPEGWARHPELVLEFYNERRAAAWRAEPNAAHRAIAELERRHDVVVVTQNVDALHERAGSTSVVHLHGELAWVRGTSRNPRRYRVDGAPIAMGQCCEDGTQLRPDIVWFGEDVPRIPEAIEHVRRASHLLVVGTSLVVYPAASLVGFARPDAVKVVVALELDVVPAGYEFRRGKATERVPEIVAEWSAGGSGLS